MGWQDDLQKCSFRGVEFHVEGGDGRMGRRIITHEYALRDEPYIEDNGAAANQFTLEAFILGDDLRAKREALISALNQPGAGVLIHPRLGTLSVFVGEVRWSHDKTNRERFSIPFHKEGKNQNPTQTIDTAGVVNDRANSVLNTAQDTFEDGFSVDGWPGYVADKAGELWTDGLSSMRKLNNIGNAASSPLANIALLIDGTMGNISTLVNKPRSLAGSAVGLIQQFLGLDTRLDSLMNGYRSLDTLWSDPEPIPTTTPSRIQQLNNQNTTKQFVSTVALTETIKRVTDISSAINVTDNSQSPFASVIEANAVRVELTTRINQIALTADDAMYNALINLRNSFVAHMSAHGQSLPRTSTVQYQNTLPSLVIAQRLYGSVALEADLVSRNRLAKPLYIRAGTALEVLNG
jgi:prophage DNA circulation protein